MFGTQTRHKTSPVAGLLGAVNDNPPRRIPPGLFGAAAVRARMAEQSAPPALPGPVSGYGGGTFNLDGSEATPPDSQPVTRVWDSRGTKLTPHVGPVEGRPHRLPMLPPLQGQPGPTLGGSMRQPFDYDAALQTLAGDQKPIKDWRWALAGFGALLGNPYGLQALSQRRDGQRDRLQSAREKLLGWQHDAWQDQNRADLRAANPFSIGRDRLMYDPATGETATLYDGPEDFELYAEELGLEPGTPEYFEAVEDYVLRSNGPSAYERDIGLDDHRTGNRERLEGVRQAGRVGMENLRQRNRLGLEGTRQGNRLEVRTTPPARSRPTATDANGNKVEWDGRAWVPVR